MAGYIDELQKALKENSIRGVWHGVGEGEPTRGHFRYKDGKLQEFDPEKEKPQRLTPALILDDIPQGVESMVDGSVWYSRSRYKQHLSDHGYEITGGDHLTGKMPEPKKPSREEIREDALKAANDIKYGNAYFTEEEKQRHIEEERAFEAYKKRNR